MSVAGITELTQYLTFKLDEEIFAFDIVRVVLFVGFLGLFDFRNCIGFSRGTILLLLLRLVGSRSRPG